MKFGIIYNTAYLGADPDRIAAVARHAEECGFEGGFFSFTSLTSFPKPLGAGTLPVHVGGSSRAAARRARRGDGYFPGGGISHAERASQVELMRETAREAGRDPAALEYTRWESMGMSAADAEVLASQGVTRVVVPAASPDLAEQRGEMSAFAARVGLPRD